MGKAGSRPRPAAGDRLVGPDADGGLGLELVAGIDNDPGGAADRPQGRHHAQPDRAGPDHQHAVAVGALCPQHGVHGAGQRIDQDGRLIIHVVRHGHELRLVGDEPLAPRSAGAIVVADLGAGRQIGGPLAEVLAHPEPPGGAGLARRGDAALPAGQHRINARPLAHPRRIDVGPDLDDLDDVLVAEQHWKADVRPEDAVDRLAELDGGHVRPADSAQQRAAADPLPVGQRRFRPVAVAQRRERAPVGVADDPADGPGDAHPQQVEFQPEAPSWFVPPTQAVPLPLRERLR